MSSPETQGLDSPSELADTYSPRVFSMSGRIGRLRFLAYSLLSFAFILPVAAANAFPGLPGIVLLIASYVASYAVAIIYSKRRLNDMDRTGWLSILVVIPLINFIAIGWLMFARGTDGDNRFGKPPEKNSTAVKILGPAVPVFSIICLVGILAAISIPQYQKYMERSAQIQNAEKIQSAEKKEK